MLISYAQNFEDVLLWRALKGVERGVYVDIGAQDPLVDSVSRLFYDQGWRGIHVEATATYAAALREARPDELVLQVAVSDVRGTMSFFEIPNTGISTGDPRIAEDHRSRGFPVVETVVPTLLLQDIFEHANGEVHWLKIDVEGMERQVLSGWGADNQHPWIVCVESTLPLTQTENSDTWEDLLTRRGYDFVYFDGLNRYYVSSSKPELRAAFSNGPNLFDNFTLSGTQTSSFCFHVLERQRQERDEVQSHVQALGRRIRELEAASLRSSDQFLNARIEALRSDARRHEEDWIKRERALQRTIDELNVQILDIQRERRSVEKDVFANVLALKDAVRAAEAAAADERGRFVQTLHESDLQVANLQYQLKSSIAEAEDLRVRLVAARADSALFQKDISDAAEKIDELQSGLADSRNACRVLSAEREEMVLGRAALLVEIENSAAAYEALKREAEDQSSSYSSFKFEAETTKERIGFEMAALRGRVEAEERKLALARHQLELAQAYIVALRSSASWRMTHLFRRIGVLFGKKLQAAPDFRISMDQNEGAQTPDISGEKNRSSSAADLPAGGNVLPMVTAMNAQNDAIIPASSITELTAYYDEAFVHCAYVTLLGRQPDTAGMAHYLGRVRAGDSKNQIIWELSQSQEAKVYGAKLPGLIRGRSVARRIAAVFRRTFGAMTGQSAQLRAWRVAENHTGRQMQLMLSQIDQIGTQITILGSVVRESGSDFARLNMQLIDIDNASRRGMALLDEHLISLRGDMENRHQALIDTFIAERDSVFSREDLEAMTKLNGRAAGIFMRLKTRIAAAAE